MKKIILASQSPRRRELLGRLVADFSVMADDSEEVVISGEKPEDTVQRLARQKAENVARAVEEDALVLAADTVVALDGRILGKPAHVREARQMLADLSGREHRVYTGIAVLDTAAGVLAVDYEMTRVRFRTLSEDEIQRYIDSGEPMDKAGAYGIQELGALFVEGVDGDYFNVVGLPLCKLGKMLKKHFSVDLLAEGLS